MNKIFRGYKVTAFESHEPIIELSPDIITELNLDIAETVTLTFGNSSALCHIVKRSLDGLQSGGTLRIAKIILKKLGIPDHTTLSLGLVEDQVLRFGPVIGILTFRKIVDAGRFWFYLNYARFLGSGLLYVFDSNGINPKTKTVRGYCYNHSAQMWIQGTFPYPDAVIDLCYPNAYRAHQFLEKEIGTGRIFNKKTLINKLDFYNALKVHRFLIPHLPETRVLTQEDDLKDFLSRYPEIFLKPVSGMQGKGIVKVSRHNNILECQYRLNSQNITQTLLDTSDIFNILKELAGTRSQYIIQNAIPRLEYKGSPFCFRTMVCKNQTGRWIAPAIFTKAASDQGFLTNHASGARFVPLKNLFENIKDKVPLSKIKLINQLVQLSVKTAQALDQKYGPLGKLGIDTVLDQSGKPWLIEANGNPGPVPVSHTVEFPRWVHQAYRLPLSYAAFLAGFGE